MKISRKAEAHDREDAERGGKLILVQECGDEAHHNADAAAQYHVIDEALPGGEPLALSGAGVLAGQAGLAEGQTGDNRQNEDGDAGQVGGGGAGAADDGQQAWEMMNELQPDLVVSRKAVYPRSG